MSLSIRVRNNVSSVERDVEQKVEDALRKAAYAIEGQAKAGVPPRVDTGYMQTSIYANGGGNTWRVDSPAEYSIYHEFGTRYMSAHPFMVPALERVKPWLLADLREARVTTSQNPVAVGLYTKLKTHSALTALLSGGTASVYEGVAPAAAAAPYVVFQTQSPSTPLYTAGGGTAWEDTLYTVKGVTEGWSKAPGGTIADKIDDALNGQVLTVTGYTNVHLHRVQDVDYPELLEGKQFHHRGAIFRVRVAPA